jgi:hypothetical protein
MTDFLTIDGVPYPVAAQGATINPRRYVGERSPSFSNVLRSTREVGKRQWGMAIGPIPRATFDTLDTRVKNDQPVNVGGASIGPAAVNCYVEINAQYVKDRDTHQMIAIVTIDEI